MLKLIFVCLGNICRSPMAEAVMQDMVNKAELGDKITIESSGTSGWHNGEPAHSGTRDILYRNGIMPNGKVYRGRSQEISRSDYSGENTWIIAMDNSNVDILRQRFGNHPNLSLLLDYASKNDESEVPDPFYVGGFDRVLELVEDGCTGLLATIRQQYGL